MPKNTAIIAQTPVERRLKWIPSRYRAGYLTSMRGEGSPREAIKAMCLQCIGYDPKEITRCTSTACPLYAFRPFQTTGLETQEGQEAGGVDGDRVDGD
jgi:hypothetical protein